MQNASYKKQKEEIFNFSSFILCYYSTMKYLALGWEIMNPVVEAVG